MSDENPTGEASASIEERIERFFEPETQEAKAQDENQEQEVPEAEAEKEPTGDDTDTTEEPQIAISDLAEYLGIEESLLDVDADGHVIFKTNIGGKEGTAKLTDFVKSYQVQGHADAQMRQAAEERKAIAQQRAEFEAHAQSEAQRIEQMAQVANHLLMNDFANINWQELAQTDPASYVVLKEQYQSRQTQVNHLMNAAKQQKKEADYSRQVNYQQNLQKAAERIAADVEGWQPGNEVDLNLNKFAHENGFENTQAIMAEYPQAAKILWEAQQYRLGKQSASVAEKKVRTAPKLIKPGQSVTSTQRKDENVRGLKDQIRNSGGKKGIEELLMATGRV